jgi:amino acid adenylation domain-containing protein/non-ribosomal peptide synthase protein (TIGR01720 family)
VPTPKLIHRLFEEAADRTPDAIALYSGERSISFAGLDRAAEVIAQAILARRGLPPDATLPPNTMIGLALGRGIEATAGALGILKAGGAWVPLDPSYPESRLKFMLGDTAAPLVLTTRPLLEKLSFLTDAPAGTLCLDEILATASSTVQRRPDRRPAEGHADPLAYVFYTSGSTGTPKGVLGPHRAMLSRFEWMWEAFPFAADELCCNKTALNFVDSVWEMFGGLLKGIPSVIADDVTARDPLALLDLLAKRRVTRVIVVPSLLAALIDAARHTGTRLDALRYVTSSGELLPSTLGRRIGELAPNATVLNLYGSSEMAADATCCVVGLDALKGKIVSIGKALGRMRVHVLDEELRPVAVGEPGELCVSGPGLARGYHNNPGLTAEKFIQNPFATAAEAEHVRLFRSGDLVSLRPDGEIDYIGRRDFQIKLRGFRIEPGEIETTLAAHPAVRDCAVSAIDTEGGRQLVAFYVRSPGADTTDLEPSALRDFLSQRLVPYMVPSHFVALADDLPRLPNGKLDRRSLRLPPDFDVRQDIVAPRDSVEEDMVRIWRETLGIRSVSVTDDFFELGGDSLLTFRVSLLAREAGYALTPRDLYEYPTLEALARRARSAQALEIDTSVPEGDAPLSPMQRYYFTWARPNPNKFNVGFIARLPALLDPSILQRALRVVIEHHHALRLRFRRSADGEFHQYYETGPGVFDVPIHAFRLPTGDEGARLAFIEKQVAALHDSLDIDKGPVMTVGLFEDPAGTDHHFFFTMHELVTDAMSLQITLEDLRTAYTALAADRRPVLPARTTPFHQWVDRVVDYTRGPAAEAQWAYWLEQARDVQPFPEDAADASALQRDIDLLGFEILSRDEVNDIRGRLAGGFQPTLIHAIVAGLALTAHRISGQRNLVFHKVAHGRETCIPGTDVSRTVGWFITHTPITVRLPDGPLEGAEALARVLDRTAEQYRAIPDNGLAHSALRYFSDDTRTAELARFDQVKTLFQYIGDVWEENYDGTLFQPTVPSLMDLPDTVAAENQADYHLHVYAYVMDGCFRMKLFYTRPNHRVGSVERMASLMRETIRGMLL